MNFLASEVKIYNYILVNTSEKTTYFFSDAHLGAGTPEQERIKLAKLRLLLNEIGGAMINHGEDSGSSVPDLMNVKVFSNQS